MVIGRCGERPFGTSKVHRCSGGRTRSKARRSDTFSFSRGKVARLAIQDSAYIPDFFKGQNAKAAARETAQRKFSASPSLWGRGGSRWSRPKGSMKYQHDNKLMLNALHPSTYRRLHLRRERAEIRKLCVVSDKVC